MKNNLKTFLLLGGLSLSALHYGCNHQENGNTVDNKSLIVNRDSISNSLNTDTVDNEEIVEITKKMVQNEIENANEKISLVEIIDKNPILLEALKKYLKEYQTRFNHQLDYSYEEMQNIILQSPQLPDPLAFENLFINSLYNDFLLEYEYYYFSASSKYNTDKFIKVSLENEIDKNTFYNPKTQKDVANLTIPNFQELSTHKVKIYSFDNTNIPFAGQTPSWGSMVINKTYDAETVQISLLKFSHCKAELEKKGYNNSTILKATTGNEFSHTMVKRIEYQEGFSGGINISNNDYHGQDVVSEILSDIFSIGVDPRAATIIIDNYVSQRQKQLAGHEMQFEDYSASNQLIMEAIIFILNQSNSGITLESIDQEITMNKSFEEITMKICKNLDANQLVQLQEILYTHTAGLRNSFNIR